MGKRVWAAYCIIIIVVVVYYCAGGVGPGNDAAGAVTLL